MQDEHLRHIYTGIPLFNFIIIIIIINIIILHGKYQLNVYTEKYQLLKSN